jgi:hypothetical protein
MRRFALILALALPLAAQTSVTWTNKTLSPTNPENGGYGKLSDNFDTLSGQMIGYVQWRFQGTVSVTNGSNIATWVSGDQFSIVWHHGDSGIRIGATNVTLASGQIPTNCGALAISCTTYTMASNWAGTSGTYAYQSGDDKSIYSDCIAFYATLTNTWTRTNYCWGSLDNQVIPDNNIYGIPAMRQNNGMLTIDTNRHRFYLTGGVNENFDNASGLVTNGTSTVTTTGAGDNYFVQGGGLWVGMTVGFPVGAPTTKCTVTAVASELSMTIGSCTAGFPNGITSVQYYPAEMPGSAGGQQQNCITDMWYMTLNSTISSNTMTEVSGLTWNSNSMVGLKNQAPMTYDADDDAIFLYSYQTPFLWVYCSVDGNPGSTLTAKQIAAGCTANQFTSVTTTGTTPGSIGGSLYSGSLMYDVTYHWMLEYGGGPGAPPGTVRQTDVYRYIPTTKVWSAMSSTSQPPADTAHLQFMSEVVLNTNLDTLFYHYPDGPADYSYSLASNAWSTVTSGGSIPAGAQFIGFDSNANIAVEMSQASPYNVWQGAFPGSGPSLNISLTVQEALYPGDNTGHTYSAAGGISRTSDYWCNGVPIPDTVGLTSLSNLSITGASAGQFRTLENWPDGNIRDIEVCGVIASYTAGTAQTVTLVNSGSGNFGTPSTMTSVGSGTITINTTGGTCGSGSAVCFTMLAGANFDGIDTAKIGSTTLVATGTSTGFQVIGPAFSNTDCGSATACTTAYTSKNDSASTCTVEKDGPVEADVLCNGSLKDGSANVYMTYTARFYFHNGSSKIKVVSVLKNAAYGTSNTFASAWKGMQAWEFRMGSNLGLLLSWNIGNHTGVTTPTTGTMTLTDVVFIYQGQNTTFGDGTWSTCTSPCNAFTTDTGYTIKKNGTASQTGTNAQAPVGYAYVANVSGNYIETGNFLFAGLGPRSLEFQSGGTGTDAIRVGLFSAQNTFSVHLAWPQWRTDEFYLAFGTSAPASNTAIANVFLTQQHPLIANASVSQWNASGILTYPLDTAADEDAYYYSTVTSASPSVTTTSGCAGGASYLTLGCIYDVGTQTPSQWPLLVYPLGYTWEQGGGRDQIEWRESWMYNWITRGHTGRYLQVKQFEMMQQDQWNSHTDGTYTWRGEPTAQLDTTGRPNATSSGPTGTCNTNGTTTVTSASGAFFEPWYHSTSGGETITIGGTGYSVASVQSPTSLTTTATVPTATGATCTYSSLGVASLRTWSFAGGAGIDNAHSHVTGAFRYYEMSGDETQHAAIRNTFDDYLLNLNTNQASVTSQIGLTGTGGTSTTTLTIATGGPLPGYVTVGYPILIGSTVTNYAAYTITNISGSTITLATSAPTITSPNAKWIVLGSTLSQRAAGLSMTNGAKYFDLLTALGDSSDAATALQLAENVYYMGVKPPLCVSGYPTGCAFGSVHNGPWESQGTSVTRGLMYQSYNVGVTDTPCDASAVDNRASSPFQMDIEQEGLWDLRRAAGSSWADYTTAFDLISGGFLWNLSEGSNFDGTASWTNNGYRYYVATDIGNCAGDTTYYPVRSNQSLWSHPLFWNYYYGVNPTLQQNFLAQSIQRFMSSNPAGIGITGYSIDVGAYQLNSFLYALHNGTTATLQTLPITSFTNNGGGSYTIGWTTLAGTSVTRAKYGSQIMVDWLGFDPVNNVFDSTKCAANLQLGLTNCGSPTTSQPWFSGTEITGMPSPVVGTQTKTVTGLASTTLTSANFMVKAMTTSSPPSGCTPAITSPSAAATVSGTSQALTATFAGCSGIYQVSYYVQASNGAAVTQDDQHMAGQWMYGTSRTALGNVTWNPFNTSFGSPYTTLQAVVKDATGAVLGTSPAVTFTTVTIEPTATFAWSIATSASPWSGTITITPTYTGTNSTHGRMACFVDGQVVIGGSGAISGAGSIDTTKFNNASHIIRCNGEDNSLSLPGLGLYPQEWEQVVTFAN